MSARIIDRTPTSSGVRYPDPTSTSRMGASQAIGTQPGTGNAPGRDAGSDNTEEGRAPVSGELKEPGWYPDRNDPAYNRYWNGRAWTARRHPVGSPPPVIVDRASPGPQAATERPEPTEQSRPKQRIPAWMWVIGALFLVRSVFSLMAAFDHPAPGTPIAVPSQPAVVVPAPGTQH